MKTLALLLFTIVTATWLPLNAQISASFVHNSERWSIIPGTVPVKHQAGGPTNGYIYSADILQQNQAINWFFTASPAFTGNLTPYFRGALSFRMRLLRRGASTLNGFYDVVIVGANGQALIYKFANLPNNEWTPYRLRLDAKDPNWRVIPANQVQVNTSNNPWFSANLPTPNDRQFFAIISNVRSLHIRGEFMVGDDSCALDEVFLNKPKQQ
ncbi:MAG: hypothetical protein KDD15_08350 [Lewinella sp.]|nr:hypothetical protein [Lewinella sp.]